LGIDPGITSWGLTDTLLSAHLAGSDTAALGGDLAYQYNLNGNTGGYRPGFCADGDQRCQLRCVAAVASAAGWVANRHGKVGLGLQGRD